MPLEYAYSDVVVPGNVPTIVATRDASRRYLIVSSAFTTATYVLWPQQRSFGPGIGVVDGSGYILLHRNVLLDLITSDWYCYSPLGLSVSVLDVRDT